MCYLCCVKAGVCVSDCYQNNWKRYERTWSFGSLLCYYDCAFLVCEFDTLHPEDGPPKDGCVMARCYSLTADWKMHQIYEHWSRWSGLDSMKPRGIALHRLTSAPITPPPAHRCSRCCLFSRASRSCWREECRASLRSRLRRVKLGSSLVIGGTEWRHVFAFWPHTGRFVWVRRACTSLHSYRSHRTQFPFEMWARSVYFSDMPLSAWVARCRPHWPVSSRGTGLCEPGAQRKGLVALKAPVRGSQGTCA